MSIEVSFSQMTISSVKTRQHRARIRIDAVTNVVWPSGFRISLLSLVSLLSRQLLSLAHSPASSGGLCFHWSSAFLELVLSVSVHDSLTTSWCHGKARDLLLD